MPFLNHEFRSSRGRGSLDLANGMMHGLFLACQETDVCVCNANRHRSSVSKTKLGEEEVFYGILMLVIPRKNRFFW